MSEDQVVAKLRETVASLKKQVDDPVVLCALFEELMRDYNIDEVMTWSQGVELGLVGSNVGHEFPSVAHGFSTLLKEGLIKKREPA